MPDDKIAKLRSAAEANPNDELAHFSLGSAMLDAGDVREAAKSFQRVLAINSQNSKAYELLARGQMRAGDTQYAIETLKVGHRIASKRGDMQPMNAMAAMLKELGAAVPEAAESRPAAARVATPGGFACIRCGSPGPKLAAPPFRGELGEKLFASVCNNCWQEWIRMGTKVINELRLPMYDPQAQEVYDKHMKEFLGLEK